MSRTQASLENKGLEDDMGWHVVKDGFKWPIQLGFAGWSIAEQPGTVA